MIPHLNRKNKIPWMTNDILDLSDKSRSVKKRRKFDHVAMHNFSEINKEIRRRMKEAKENWIADRCKETILESERETLTSRQLSTL